MKCIVQCRGNKRSKCRTGRFDRLNLRPSTACRFDNALKLRKRCHHIVGWRLRIFNVLAIGQHHRHTWPRFGCLDEFGVVGRRLRERSEPAAAIHAFRFFPRALIVGAALLGVGCRRHAGSMICRFRLRGRSAVWLGRRAVRCPSLCQHHTVLWNGIVHWQGVGQQAGGCAGDADLEPAAPDRRVLQVVDDVVGLGLGWLATDGRNAHGQGGALSRSLERGQPDLTQNSRQLEPDYTPN